MEQGKPPPMIGGKKGMGNGRDSEVITISSAFRIISMGQGKGNSI
jgi:hypothetical protein